jgi:hypothetical protein
MKGRWYFIYHNAALPGGGPYKRSVCVDELFYNEDGTIKKIAMTESGIEQTGDGPFKTGVKYRIVSRRSGKVLDVTDGSVSAGQRSNKLLPVIMMRVKCGFLSAPEMEPTKL